RAEDPPAADIDKQAGTTADDAATVAVFQYEVQRAAAAAGTERVDPGTRVGQSMVRETTHHRVPVAQLVRGRFAHPHRISHDRVSPSSRCAACISGGGENFRLPI